MTLDRNRLAAGLRLLPGNLVAPWLHLPRRRPDVAFDLIRANDLVALSVEGYGMELVVGPKPSLRPKEGESSRLVIGFAFQHLGESAIYEEATTVPDPSNPKGDLIPDPLAAGASDSARPHPPVPALPARSSRLVLEVPDGVEIPFSTEGVLEAISRLPMVVHPLARPKPGALIVLPDAATLHLPGGLIASVGARGLTVSKATARSRGPDTSTAAGIATVARDLRRTRALLADGAGVAVRLGDLAVDETPRTVSLGGVEYGVPTLIGPGALVRPDRPVQIRPRAELSRSPRALETAIEAPFRLVISPSDRGGWKHATSPVSAEGAPHRVELWHSRLGVRVGDGDDVEIDERSSWQRIVRAIWARDREAMPDWQHEADPTHLNVPFRMSLTGADRHMLVRQTSETWLDDKNTPIPPDPVDVDALWLSSLGAWLDLHGTWDSQPYSDSGIASILTWDHIAPLGRDQYVKVTYPGYLFPFGHKATLVKVTERKMKDAAPSVAGLYQRKFLVVTEPIKAYNSRSLPLTKVRLAPLVTPTIQDPTPEQQKTQFFPIVDGDPFRFVLHCLDQEGRPVRLVAPLMWVAEQNHQFSDTESAYNTDLKSKVPAHGQEVAFAAVKRGGDTMLPTHELRFAGDAHKGTSTPHLATAEVEVPAVQHLSPVGHVTIKLAQVFVDHGFGGSQNAGEVWAELEGAPPGLSFGGNTNAGSDRAGGFMQPDLPIRGLSRVKGTVGDVAGSAKGQFKPADFLAGALPKLFGLVPLVDLLDAVGVDLDKDAPAVVSEALDSIESFLSDLESAKTAAQEAVNDADRLVQRATGQAAEKLAAAQQALQAAQQLRQTVNNAVGDVIQAFGNLATASQTDIENALSAPFQALRQAAADMRQVAPLLPPLVQKRLLQLAAKLETVVDAADVFEDVFRFLNGLASGSKEVAFRFEWRPKLKSWPDETNPVLKLQPDSLVLAVDGRASGKGSMGVDVLAELRDFALHLLPGAEMVRFKFEHISFRGGSDGKAEVDVVINDIEFVGLLGFVEVLKDLIPLDGFSDPPYLDVSPSGITAGFSLGLPNVAVGVFSLSNMSLGADVQVPFLGKVVTVGFNFCTRERPFALSVTFIGGGGWFMMRLSPDGLEVLELGLEAGAMLSVDFGVASGSISAVIGIYMRLEGDAGSLTGYFRLRGEVDVLGLISACIELYLALTYQFDTGKMVGKARLTIKVEVLFFSASVTIEAERRFAGSNGDPSFADLMVLPDGTSPAWSEYCAAFAGA
ncbi:MAG TPA: hypothetical protein VLT32_12110 [Candidatus Sulfomarinibacteraceae bacterium]|nr:hypothetical protein [Candidatus Sulfomarinibacteraceae bacterium]